MAFADHVYAASEPRKGWECPRCGTVHNPEITVCWCAKKVKIFPPLKPRPWKISDEGRDTMTAEDRKEQFGEECAYCGKDPWTCEHFKPEIQDSDKPYSSHDEGRNPDGTGMSYGERNSG
jgi:hypothetical protein